MTGNILMASKLIRGTIPASKSLAKCSLAADLAFPRFLLLTDDWGCFLWDISVIKGQLFPKRKGVGEKKIELWLEGYRQNGMLFKWKDGQKEYGFFIHYDEYNREYESRKHARRTPEPPVDLLQKYSKHFKVVQKTSGRYKKPPHPTPIPTPTPKKTYNYPSFEEANNPEFKAYLKSIYPEVDIEFHFKNMESWIRTNPKKGQKKNYAQFVRNWISREAKKIENGKPKPFKPEPPPPEKDNGLPKTKPTLTKEEEKKIHKERIALQKKIKEEQRRKKWTEKNLK